MSVPCPFCRRPVELDSSALECGAGHQFSDTMVAIVKMERAGPMKVVRRTPLQVTP